MFLKTWLPADESRIPCGWTRASTETTETLVLSHRTCAFWSHILMPHTSRDCAIALKSAHPVRFARELFSTIGQKDQPELADEREEHVTICFDKTTMLRNGRLQRATAALCATTSASLVGSVRAEGTNTTSSHRVDAMGRPRPMMFVRDPDAFARKWKKFSTDGIEKLVVIADFDFTLTTRFKADGGQGESTHGVLTRSEALGGSASQISEGHFRKYYPIEQSVTLSNAEKLPYIVEWWTKEHEVLVEHKLTHQMIGRAVAKSEVALRQGFMEIFDVLADEDVPTLIFSAGLYDVIHAVLDKEYAKTERKTLPKNVHVVSNMMRFDPTGLLVGFQGNIIHSLNKNASVVLDTPFWKKCQLQKRENILLLGDSLTDATMTEGLDCSDDNIVRIGFLNDHVDERLDTYLKTFDVVLTHDSSLFPVELMLHQLDRVGPKQHDETKSS